ncbi:MAG TPA: carboxypeptidase-like regulatory domain-containing protein [Pseudomonas sp.]|nr:carboxypeptidase-like regulatory domain-containing protein [Pseudomonas sp.]
MNDVSASALNLIASHHRPGERHRQVKRNLPLVVVALSTLGACVPYPHSVTRNPMVEGRVLSAETGAAVANATITLASASDEAWTYETVSDTQGRFAFDEHRDYRLFTQLADAPHCATTLSISASGYHTRRCTWMSRHWCSSAPLKLPRLLLQPEHTLVSEKEDFDDAWRCIESAMEKAN